ncbi:MAG: LacI family DNA-binding transcriptional regulator [Fimbriimonadaceae bacterium]|nr:LacI family DNA-binding transcriptional regulator [Fimbriimonadaceae bacterium]
MRVTQLDIARAAKASQATVSRVLAGDVRVDEQTRDRVLKAVVEFNYRTDARARSLRTKSSGLIGLAIQRPHGGLDDDPFFTSLLSGIADYLAETDHRLCLELITDPENQTDAYDEMLRSRRVDGMILVESEAQDRRLQLLHKDRFPFVLIGNPGGMPVWSVDNDNVYAGQMATQHLIDEGFRKVHMIAGRRGVTVSDDRVLGYLRACQSAELEPKIWYGDFGYEAAQSAAALALSSEPSPDAFVVLDDFMALGVLAAARDAGRQIPMNLGVVSFNDSKLCGLTSPALSSVSLNLERLVRTALDRLMSLIQDDVDETPHREIVPCVLKARASSTCEEWMR